MSPSDLFFVGVDSLLVILLIVWACSPPTSRFDPGDFIAEPSDKTIPPTVPIPAGYALLREGDKRPPGYLWYSLGNGWRPGRAQMFGLEITAAEVETKPYIAPVSPSSHIVLPAGVTITRLIPKLCVNPSDGDLDVLFALEFTGKKFLRRDQIECLTAAELFEFSAGGWQGIPPAPKYSAQFELVLPFLHRDGWGWSGASLINRATIEVFEWSSYKKYSVTVKRDGDNLKCLARAAVIALLESRCWTIEVSHDKL